MAVKKTKQGYHVSPIPHWPITTPHEDAATGIYIENGLHTGVWLHYTPAEVSGGRYSFLFPGNAQCIREIASALNSIADEIDEARHYPKP